MKKTIISLLVLPVMIVATEGITSETISTKNKIKPVHPIAGPIVNTGLVRQRNYYNTNYEINCDKYIEILAQKDQEILALKNELEKLQNKEQQKLSKTLKESYDAELEAFDNRKSSIKTENSVTISKKPIH